MTGIRLAGLKSTGMTLANAQNRGIGWGGNTVGGAQQQLLDKEHSAYRLYVYVTHLRVYINAWACIYSIYKRSQSCLNWLLISCTKWLFHLM